VSPQAEKHQPGGVATNDATVEPAERNLRVWPMSVSEVARWCRAAKIDPIPQSEVPGANHRERQQLAALGGIATALARRSKAPVNFDGFPDPVQRWLKEAPEPPAELIDALFEDLDSSVDPLALVYERIVAGPRRRWLGTFFTPAPVLAYMRGIVKKLPQPPQAVADPGAGVGAFTVAALQWWHEAKVHAVDVNLVTLGLLATRPDLAGHRLTDTSRSRLRIRHEDFLEWLTGRWPQLDGPRLLLGNPPYTRHQQMTASEKAAARAAVGDLAPGLRSGLSTYFLAASLAALGPSDSLCLLLPANWLEADYAKPVRRRLWTSANRPTELHLFSNDLNVFPGTQVAAMVIFVGPEKKRPQRLKIFRVSGDLESGFNRPTAEEIERVGPTPPSFSPRKLLAIPRPILSGAPKETPLGVLTVVRRGVATGANSFFLRTRSEADELPADACVPAISKLRDLPSDNLDDEEHAGLSARGARCWLLTVDEGKAKDPTVQKVIDQGESLDFHQRYLCRARDPWYAVETIPAPDILIGPMGKESFRVVINTIGAIPTNTLYGLRLSRSLEGTLSSNVEILATWLRSAQGQDALRSAARNHHGDGLVKLEPGALKEVRVPQDVVSLLLR
jgi:adenine-specific DNA-methyltransferase